MKGLSRVQQIGLLCLGLALCVFVAGCGGSKVTKENADKIKKDMAEKDVKDILGEPTKTEEAEFGGIKLKVSTWEGGGKKIQVGWKDGKTAGPATFGDK
jgi:hypothetical protein